MYILIFNIFVIASILFITTFYSSLFDYKVNESFVGLRSWYRGYECGYSPRGIRDGSFRLSFVTLMIFFILFDLEVCLLLRLPFHGLLVKSYFHFLIFLILLCFGYSYELIKGYINWKF